ncbi:dihydrofolate reductase family protein [Longispora albida]|uniref:pyrimidine reductase family protein n=1 Tax=Longispora albida TaxID=203523 RepID=UPI000375A82B
MLVPGEEITDTRLAELYPRRTGIRVNFVSSLDGAVDVEGSSLGLSGPADKRVFRVLRMVCDLLLVGAGTLRREQYRALRLDPARRTWRQDHGLVEYPRLVVVSNSLDLDPDLPAFAEAPVRPLVLTHEAAPAARRAALSRTADVVPCGESSVEWPAAMEHLGGHAVLCEGGPQLMGALTTAGLADELCLTLSPQLAGPGSGRITAGAPGAPYGLRLAHALADGDVLLLRYTKDGPTP